MLKKLYYIQFRTDKSLPHEQECVLEMLKDYKDRIVFVNAVEEGLPDNLEKIAGVVLGGSGEFYLSQGAGVGAWIEGAVKFIGLLLEHDIPLFASCFGAQLLAMRGGARIVKNPEMEEVGAYEITLLPEAKNDELFKDLPEKFFVHLGHKDSAIDLPDDFVKLARSERLDCQAFRVKGKRAWGVVFHPELNKRRMGERFDLYSNYASSPDKIKDIKDSFKDTPEAAELVLRFVKSVFHP